MPADDINTRMHYFDRQFLRARDFQVEQTYHLERHRLHNKLLHTEGVARTNHLLVTGEVGQRTLTVAEGIAIDEEGREIVLLQQSKYPIDPLTEPGKYELIVRLDEVASDPSTDPGVDGSTRIREKPIFELLTPALVKPPMLRLAEIEIEPAGTLKSAPISIRTFAGTSVGASATFETVTANTIKSPTWNVTPVYVNERAMALPTPPETNICAPKSFKTGGGILLIFASGSGEAATGKAEVIGMQLLLDNNVVGRVESCVKDPKEAHKTFVTSGLVVPKIAAGQHTLTIKTTKSTQVVQNDFFSITILELPFQ